MRRCSWFLLVLVLVSTGTAHAAAPPGPRLGFLRATERRAPGADALDLVTADPRGGARQVVAGTFRPGEISPVSGFAWAPDGQSLAIGALWEHHSFESLLFNDELDLFLAAADGSGLRQLTRFTDIEGEVSDDAVSPVVSADGRTVYFARQDGNLRSSIWAIGSDGNGLRRLTAPAGATALDTPASVSPDGQELAFTRVRCFRFFVRCHSSALAVSLATGSERLIARRGEEPAYSPDGTQVAVAIYSRHEPKIENEPLPATDLYVVDASGGSARRLTRTADLTEGHPSWDPAGDRIAFSRGSSSGLLGQNLGASPRILEINADGSCETLLLPKLVRDHSHFGKNFGFPAWQPGPGREAGRIVC